MVCVSGVSYALAGLCWGARISEFVPVSAEPRVTFSTVLPRTQRLWESAAGSCAEFLIFFLVTLLAPRSRMGDLAAEVTAVFAGIELAGWTLATAIYPGGASNDAWDFLAAAGSARAAVLWFAFLASVLYVAALFMRRRARG